MQLGVPRNFKGESEFSTSRGLAAEMLAAQLIVINVQAMVPEKLIIRDRAFVFWSEKQTNLKFMERDCRTVRAILLPETCALWQSHGLGGRSNTMNRKLGLTIGQAISWLTRRIGLEME